MLCPLISIVNNSLFKIQLANSGKTPWDWSAEPCNLARSTEKTQKTADGVALRLLTLCGGKPRPVG
jgi:hypothetical protein